MKKLALTSLLAVFAISGAHAANVIDGNPLYMPRAGHFYSVTDLYSHSENSENWTLGEEFGYGVTDRLAINMKTSFSETDSFDAYGWDDFSLAGTFRVIDDGAWKADVYGSYAVDNVYPYHAPFLDQGLTGYTWVAGIRGGYVANDWTIAGHFAYEYLNSKSFNWADDGWHKIAVGLDAQYVIDPNWNLVAGVEYKTYTDDGMLDLDYWTGMFGVNYNIDATKYVGAYVNSVMDHWKDNGEKGWEVEDGFGFGFKFGIDF